MCPRHVTISQELFANSLFLLAAPTSTISEATLLELLKSIVPHDSHYDHYTIPVPLYAPTSELQAEELSEKYWPTVYKRNNPFGPHPSIVSRTQEELEPWVARWMEIAARVALYSGSSLIGEKVGVVISQELNREQKPIVIAGDARWYSNKNREGPGNVMGHATMRAIGMIARKRRILAGDEQKPDYPSSRNSDPEVIDNASLDEPMTSEERSIFQSTNLAPEGYLCTDLDIFLTHEPCVMCSMAILHSRFRRIVFGKRMPKTGGMTADFSDSNVLPELGGITHPGPAVSGKVPQQSDTRRADKRYGMFWRNELNWKLLAWEWVGTDKNFEAEMRIDDDIHA